MKTRLASALLVPVVAALGVIAIARAQPPQTPGPPDAYYLVEFEGPILADWESALRASGAEILAYVPEFAYKIRVPRGQQARLPGLPGVSAVTPIDPARKLAPDMAPSGTRAYVVTVERGANPLPVEAAIVALGVQGTRRDGPRLTVVADAARLGAIAALPDVAAIEEYRPYQRHNDFGGGVLSGATLAHAAGFDGSTQTIAIADSGLGGGAPGTAHRDLMPARVRSIFNWPGASSLCFSSIVDDGAADVDSGHGTHVTMSALGAGAADGTGRGTAPGAALVFQALENWAQVSWICSFLYGLSDGYYLVGIPPDIRDLFQQGYDAGARVQSNSWGSDAAGAYTSASADTDAFLWARRDMAMVVSAGNAGTDANGDGIVDGGSIASPATAKNVITVGASENDRHSRWNCDPALAYTDCAARGGQNALFTYGGGFPGRFNALPLRDDPSAGNAGQMAAFSSRGPTSDGRIKPDVVAPGTWVLSGYSNRFRQHYDASPNPANGRYQYDGWGHPADADYKYMGGTSMAAPLVAGAAAVVRDYYEKTAGHQASAALVKATLINSAVDLLDENNDGIDDNAYPIPNMHEGWGRVDLAAATGVTRHFVDEQTSLATGERVAFILTATGTPLKATLVWTDHPGTATAARALVNDLDLQLNGPDGSVYVGNAFSGGWSIGNGTPDRLNNVENVYLAAPAPGPWTVIVTGFNIPMGPQPFALVIDGAAGPIAPVDPPPALPVVTVTASAPTAHEAGSISGAFNISRTGDVTASLEVTYVLSGTATPGADYVPLPGRIVIPAGSTAATLLVEPLDDELSEPDETVVISLASDAGYQVGEPAVATVSIVSDDAPADLVVTAVTAPAASAAGARIEVSDTTKNRGAGRPGPSETGFYLSANTLLDAADVLLGSRPVVSLAPDDSSTETTPLQIPGATVAGSYYVIAKADWSGAVAESSETNNLRVSSVVRIGPDLTVASVQAPAAAAPGASVTVHDTTANVGAGSAPASSTAFYLSANTLLDSSDVLLGRRTVAPLEAGAGQDAATPLTIPTGTGAGLYYVIAAADDPDAVREARENNNVKASAGVRIGADLTVAALSGPPVAAAGQTISVTDTTRNAGAGPAPASATGFYLTTSVTLKDTDPLVGIRDVPALEAGAEDASQAQLTIPAGTPPGSYFIVAKADAAGAVAEANEGNNTRATTVKTGPDLTVSVVTAPPMSGAGRSFEVSDTVRNVGLDPAGPTSARLYLSANATLDASDALLESRGVPPLAGEASHTAATRVTIPESTPTGTYYVIVAVDPDDRVAEFSETNNTGRSGAIRIGPDLRVTSLAAPSSAVAGSSIAITDTTDNAGGGEAPPSSTRFYLSINTTFDSSDVLVGERLVGALAAGGASSGATLVALPGALEARTYYLIAVADAGGEIDETSETNNRRVVSIRITRP